MKNLFITIFVVLIIAFVPYASFRVNVLQNQVSSLQNENQTLELNNIDLQSQISILEQNQNNVVIENDLLDVYFGSSPLYSSLNFINFEENVLARPTMSMPSDIKSIQYQIELTKSQTQNFITLKSFLKFKFWSGLETDYLRVSLTANERLLLDEPFDSENNSHFFIGLEYLMNTIFLDLQFDTYQFGTNQKLTTYVPTFYDINAEDLQSSYSNSYFQTAVNYFYDFAYNSITQSIEEQIYLNSGIGGAVYYNNDIPFNYFVKINIV